MQIGFFKADRAKQPVNKICPTQLLKKKLNRSGVYFLAFHVGHMGIYVLAPPAKMITSSEIFQKKYLRQMRLEIFC